MVFLFQIPFFRVYREYFTNYESGIELLEKLSKKKEVSAYLKVPLFSPFSQFKETHIVHKALRNRGRWTQIALFIDHACTKTSQIHSFIERMLISLFLFSTPSPSFLRPFSFTHWNHLKLHDAEIIQEFLFFLCI